MANTDLYGPFNLDKETIDKKVKGLGAGAYALEKRSKPDTFVVNYVGRSDTDLNDRLKNWCDTKYKRFKYAFYDTAKAAFLKECRLYHDFGETDSLDNEQHPERPTGKDWECPICDIFDN